MNKKKIFLILPNTLGSKGAVTAPPPGLAYLGAMALEKGHVVRACDLRVDSEKEMYKRVDLFRPDYIGISFMSFGYKGVYRLIERIKKRYPSLPIIVGGAHISLFPKRTMEESKADFGFYGESELTFAEFLSSEDYKKIRGLVWRDEKNNVVVNPPREFNMNLDKLPFPRYNLFPLKKYVDKKIPLVSSRGCPFGCIFCGIEFTMGKKFRPRSASNIVKEIEQWYGKGYRFFHFVDDNFAQDSKRVIEICNLIIKNSLKIKWDLRNGIRVDKVNYDFLLKMKKAGCIYFVLSVESFDDEVLRIMRKGINTKMIFEAIDASEKVGIPFGISVLVGLPGDNYNKFIKNYKLVKKFNFDEARFYNVIPYPKTELDRMIREKGRYLKTPEKYLNEITTFGNDPLYDYPGFSVEEKKKALEMSEKIVMSKLIIKEFGPMLGSIGYFLWKIKIIRVPIMKIGVNLWGFLRKIKRYF